MNLYRPLPLPPGEVLPACYVLGRGLFNIPNQKRRFGRTQESSVGRETKEEVQGSRYQTLLENLKKGKEPALEVADISTSPLTQLQNMTPKVLGKGKGSVRTVSKSLDGKKSTVWVIKVGPQTKPILEAV